MRIVVFFFILTQKFDRFCVGPLVFTLIRTGSSDEFEAQNCSNPKFLHNLRKHRRNLGGEGQEGKMPSPSRYLYA